MRLTPTSLALLTSAPFLASASPLPPAGTMSLPAGTTMLGFDDPASGYAVAYDDKGTALGNVTLSAAPKRRDDTIGSCALLTADEMQKIPGWNNLKSIAEGKWGTGKYTVKANPPEWPDSGAVVCVNGRSAANPPNIAIQGTPNCAESSQSTDGQFVNVAGTVALTGNEGTLATATSTVTKESAIGADVSVAAEVDFPLIAKFTSTVTVKSTFTNSLAKATTSGSNTQQGRTFTINPSAGQTCHLEYHAQSCTVSGTGVIPFVASGWAWFTYDKKTQDHWNWALLMEAYLTNEADRTSNMELKVDLSSSTNSDYKGVCTGGTAAGANSPAVPASPSGNLGGASSVVSKGTGSSAKPSASGRPASH